MNIGETLKQKHPVGPFSCRKNHVFEFVPDRLPEFPLKKFEKVSGDAFFVDESILVNIYFIFLE